MLHRTKNDALHQNGASQHDDALHKKAESCPLQIVQKLYRSKFVQCKICTTENYALGFLTLALFTSYKFFDANIYALRFFVVRLFRSFGNLRVDINALEKF